MKLVGVRVKDADDRVRYRRIVCCDDSRKEKKNIKVIHQKLPHEE